MIGDGFEREYNRFIVKKISWYIEKYPHGVKACQVSFGLYVLVILTLSFVTISFGNLNPSVDAFVQSMGFYAFLFFPLLAFSFILFFAFSFVRGTKKAERTFEVFLKNLFISLPLMVITLLLSVGVYLLIFFMVSLLSVLAY